MSDLVTFLKARLDEDERLANARCGIFPSPGIEGNGAVWLHIKRGGNAVVVHYTEPAAGYGDMADLKAWADTEQGQTQARVLAEVTAKRAVLALHAAYPWPEVEHIVSCRTCGLRQTHPCPTLRVLASVYASHRDYDPGWSPA